MKIFTPRGLVRRMLKVDSLTQARLDRAVALLQLEKWVLNHHPQVTAGEHPLVAVRPWCTMAELLRLTYQASRRGAQPAWM